MALNYIRFYVCYENPIARGGLDANPCRPMDRHVRIVEFTTVLKFYSCKCYRDGKGMGKGPCGLDKRLMPVDQEHRHPGLARRRLESAPGLNVRKDRGEQGDGLGSPRAACIPGAWLRGPNEIRVPVPIVAFFEATPLRSRRWRWEPERALTVSEDGRSRSCHTSPESAHPLAPGEILVSDSTGALGVVICHA